MKSTTLIALPAMLASIAVAQTHYPPGTALTEKDLPEFEVMWVAFMRVDDLEIPRPPSWTGGSCSGLECVSKAEESTGDGVRFLQDTVYMTAEGAEKAVRLIRAALQEWVTLGPNRLKDDCARNAIPADSLAAFAAYLEEEARASDAKRAQLVEDFLAALSPADSLAFRQWSVASGDVGFGTAVGPELLPTLEARQVDVKALAADMCKPAAETDGR